MVPIIDNSTNKSDGVKEVIMGMKHNQAAGTDRLQAEKFKCGGNKKKYDGNCEKSVRGRRKAIKKD